MKVCANKMYDSLMAIYVFTSHSDSKKIIDHSKLTFCVVTRLQLTAAKLFNRSCGFVGSFDCILCVNVVH